MSQPLPRVKEHILRQDCIQPAGFMQFSWEAKVSPSIPVSELTNPTFWQQHPRDMRPLDRIYVAAEDASYWAELLVTQVGVGYAHVKVLRHIQLIEDEKEVDATSRHLVKWNGPNGGKFSVVDTASGNTLKTDIQTKKEAHEWLDKHLKGAA